MIEQPEHISSPTSVAELDHLRADLISRAKKIFGNGVDTVCLGDERFSPLLRDEFQRFQFAGSDQVVAVQCGPPSNLCVVALALYKENEGLLKSFFNRNQFLFKSVRTVWRNILFCWVRIESGWRPANRALSGALWITSGWVPAVNVDKQVPGAYPFPELGDAVATFQFNDFKWSPGDHETFLLERVEIQYGKFILQTGPRKRTLNVQAVAHFLSAALGIIFDKNANQFYMCPPAEPKLEAINKNRLNDFVSTFLQQQVVKSSATFPVTNNQVSAVITVLKVICAVERPAEPEGLKQYLCERLERRLGSNLTTREIFTAYIDFCKTTGIRAYPECVFLDELPKAIRERFGLTRANNVMRPINASTRLTARRGFNGLAIRSADGSDAKDGRDASDGADGDVANPS